MLESGLKLKDVAAQFSGVSLHALTRHRRKCLAVPLADGTEALEQHLNRWLARSEQLFQAGGLTADLRSQAAAIGSALRTLEHVAKNQTRLQEQAQAQRDLPTDGSSLTPDEAAKMRAYMDWIIEEGSKTLYASTEVRIMGLNVQMQRIPDLLPVFQKLADDPTLLAATQNLMKGAA